MVVSGKICKRGGTAIIWRFMENVMSFFSENKNSTYNEKNSEILLIKLEPISVFS
jgi:hypothetical protein